MDTQWGVGPRRPVRGAAGGRRRGAAGGRRRGEPHTEQLEAGLELEEKGKEEHVTKLSFILYRGGRARPHDVSRAS